MHRNRELDDAPGRIGMVPNFVPNTEPNLAKTASKNDHRNGARSFENERESNSLLSRVSGLHARPALLPLHARLELLPFLDAVATRNFTKKADEKKIDNPSVWA